jgi:hypothetical protein
LYGAVITGANNIIYGNLNVDGTANYPVINGPLTATFTYSDIEGGLTGTGNINVDPLFANTVAGNYQLAAGSPAIDTALATGPATDILGIARPQGAAPDMGAYEYVAPVLPPVNGTCGSSNGGFFTAAPAANLCTDGTASAVAGTGPFNWSCAGSDGGTTASCSAQLQVVTPPADVTPPTAVSFVTSGTSGYNAAITVTFSEKVLMTKPLGTIVKIGTFNTAVTGTGSVFTVRLMSCCISKLVAGTTYTLTIPAGSFRDSAGNLNTLITAPVVFGAVPAPTPVNGVCGSANSGTFAVAPVTNLCSAGTASAVAGANPFVWSCTGSNGGTTASCSAQLQIVTPPPADVTAPTAVSFATSGTTGASAAITVAFSENVTATKPLGTVVKIGTLDTTVTVSGSLATIKLMSCCVSKLVPGTVYTLTIPAGSFRDAAGNLNAAITASVSFGTTVDKIAPTVATTVVTKGGTVSSDIITVTFTEAVTATKALGTIMKIGTSDTTYTVNGATVAIKIMNCCLNKVRVGNTYNLTIPAGSFKDAAGNLNAAISVPVTL